MNTITALIAEDEPILAQTLAHTLKKLWPELDIIDIVENGVDAVKQTLALRPKVVFLDIKMPGQTGLEAAQELAEEWPDEHSFPLIVFVTAYDQYALQAFDHAAVDYVLKPVNEARLGKTIERIQQRLQQDAVVNSPVSDTTSAQGTSIDGELQRIMAQLRAITPAAPPATERLTIIRAAVGNQIRLIPIDDVLYFEATDKYVNVVTAEHQSLIRSSLRDLMGQIDPNHFWQIHRSTVVNIRSIQIANKDEAGKITLKLKHTDEILKVSRVFAHLFKQM